MLVFAQKKEIVMNIHPSKDDKYWKDARGKLHHIEHMDARYAEACIRVCHANGSEIPDALMKRWRGRHKDNIAMFEELNND